ncbi:MAG: hypothetical protein EHM70_25720 [Chloroflexota bacterium]|nr:MAG: hypothetical protein EHM70_25720 [Chloroflexota bacterium]
MNNKNLWIAALSGAVLTTLVSNLPFIDLVNFLCFAGFWGSAIFTVWLYRRISGTLTIGDSVRLGALTGLCAGVLGFALSFVGLAGYQGTANELAMILPPESMQEIENVSAWGILAFNLVGVSFNILFGTIGGWIGGMIFRTRRNAEKIGALA